MKVGEREIFVPSPAAGTYVSGGAFYTRPSGLEMMSIHGYETRNDICDVSFHRWSDDNGRTWSEPRAVETYVKADGVARQRCLTPGILDPRTGRLLFFILQGYLPNENCLDGMTHYGVLWAISEDGGRSLCHEEPLVQRGDQYSEMHPIEGVWIGRNCIMNGVNALWLETGQVLFPAMVTRLGPDGNYYNPLGAFTYTDVVVLLGTWERGRLAWDWLARVEFELSQSTRGAIEPTLAAFPAGRILMVMRGSNSLRPQMPGYKWYCVSSDGGRRWTPPEPWGYVGGERFFSPSSISMFLPHSSGRTFWIGNIAPRNPDGNQPRYPLVIAEVDADSLMLIKDSVTVVEDRRPEDHPGIQFSNFQAHEDRQTGEVVVYLPFFYTTREGWTGSLHRYRVAA